MRFDKELIRGHLGVPEALRLLGYGEGKEACGQIRFDHCPGCGPGTRRRGKLVANSKVFDCKACGFAGDVFAVVAKAHKLDSKRDFHEVIKRSAEIAGVDGEPSEERSTFVERRRREQRRYEERLAHERAVAEQGAGLLWSEMRRTSFDGHDYLSTRGIAAAAADVRYSSLRPKRACIALRQLGGDTVINIVGRHIYQGEPKVSGLARCRVQGHFGNPLRIEATVGAVVVVEGWADWLTVRAMQPDRLVLGAHGANQLPNVARIAADVALSHDRPLTLVPHRDDAGRTWSLRAMHEAISFGLEESRIDIFDVGRGCNDLNDWWMASKKGGQR